MKMLSKHEIEQLKQRLEEMRDKLNGNLKVSVDNVKQGARDTAGYSQHQADEGTDAFDKTISIEMTSQEFGLLKQINRALEKIEEGSYGICDVTGEKISIKRLNAIPYAIMTVEAQEKLEKGLL